MGFCKYCGTKNEEDAQYCERFGKNLIDQDKLESEPLSKHQKPLKPQNGADNSIDKKPSTVILILGYLLAFLGGIFGIAMGIYLFTRKNSDAKFHGRNMIIIASILLIVGVASSAYLLSNFTPGFFGPYLYEAEPGEVLTGDGLTVTNLRITEVSEGNYTIAANLVPSEDFRFLMMTVRAYDSGGAVLSHGSFVWREWYALEGQTYNINNSFTTSGRRVPARLDLFIYDAPTIDRRDDDYIFKETVILG